MQVSKRGVGCPSYHLFPILLTWPEHQHLGFRLLTAYTVSQYSNSLQSWLLKPGNAPNTLQWRQHGHEETMPCRCQGNKNTMEILFGTFEIVDVMMYVRDVSFSLSLSLFSCSERTCVGLHWGSPTPCMCVTSTLTPMRPRQFLFPCQLQLLLIPPAVSMATVALDCYSSSSTMVTVYSHGR